MLLCRMPDVGFFRGNSKADDLAGFRAVGNKGTPDDRNSGQGSPVLQGLNVLWSQFVAFLAKKTILRAVTPLTKRRRIPTDTLPRTHAPSSVFSGLQGQPENRLRASDWNVIDFSSSQLSRNLQNTLQHEDDWI